MLSLDTKNNRKNKEKQKTIIPFFRKDIEKKFYEIYWIIHDLSGWIWNDLKKKEVKENQKKKNTRRIAKILASLAIVISLGSAIAWHLMMDAQAHDYSKENIGSSKHFESGEALIR